MPIAMLDDVEFTLDGETFQAKWRGPRLDELDDPGHWEITGDTWGPFVLVLCHATNVVELGTHALQLVQAIRRRDPEVTTTRRLPV